MTQATERAWVKPSFLELIRFRKEWKEFHEKQDRQNADRVFRLAGVELITDLDLKFFPNLFRQKLNEFGRDWERPLAVAALKNDYILYRAELLMSIDQSSEVHQKIEMLLSKPINADSELPVGTPLFFESNGLHALKDSSWDSLFYFVLHPSRTPESLQLEAAPGILRKPVFLRIV